MAEEKNQDPTSQQAGETPKAPEKKDTSRIELSAAETDDTETGSGEPLSVRQVVDKPGGKTKSETARIDLDEAESAVDEESVEMGKDSTVRVDLTGAMARMQTGEGEKKPAEAPAEAEAKPEKSADERGATARIALEGVEPTAAGGEPPRTVRLKRPSSAPRTVVMARPSGEPPRTVVLKRPESAEADESEKGTTSRIQVPDSATAPTSAPTGRKTIRIKRSGAGGGAAPKTLTIARPTKSTPATLPSGADETLKQLEAEVSDQPGPVFGLLAIAALLVLCALVYVLAAQTVAPDLPFPGRIL